MARQDGPAFLLFFWILIGGCARRLKASPASRPSTRGRTCPADKLTYQSRQTLCFHGAATNDLPPQPHDAQDSGVQQQKNKGQEGPSSRGLGCRAQTLSTRSRLRSATCPCMSLQQRARVTADRFTVFSRWLLHFIQPGHSRIGGTYRMHTTPERKKYNKPTTTIYPRSKWWRERCPRPWPTNLWPWPTLVAGGAMCSATCGD